MERFLLIFHLVLLLWKTCLADEEFCSKGFQVAARYHDCWQQAKFSHKYPDLYEPHEILDATFLENFAIHMCSVVKPDALGCFKKSLKPCSNRAKLIGVANESGGACKGKSLNPFFKKHVVDNLVPVTGDRDSPCFTIGENAYNACYIAAGRKVLDSGRSDEISRFHKVADLLFNSYWDCLIDAYKSQADLCPNWQIPMLLMLQKTALPNLFGMLLTPEQVEKLELESPHLIKDNKTTPKPSEECEKKEHRKLYLLMQLLSKRPSLTTSSSNMVVELSNLDSDQPELSIEGAQNDQDTEVASFLSLLAGPNTESSLRDRLRQRKEELEKNKALEDLSRKLKGEEVETETKKTKKNKKKRKKGKGKRKGKKKSSKKKKKKVTNILDRMIQ